MENKIVVICPQKYSLAKKRKISLADLKNEKIIGYGAHIPFGELINRHFEKNGIILPKPIFEVFQTHVACSLVQEGLGVALVDEITLSGGLWRDIVVIELAEKINVPIYCMSLRIEPLSHVARNFQKTLANLSIIKL